VVFSAALPTADITRSRTSLAMRLRENSRSASAVSTFLPRIICASRLSFCGETLRFRATALASLSLKSRSRFALPIVVRSQLARLCRRRRCRCRRCRGRSRGRLRPDRFFVAAVPVEGPGRRELAELVADHVLGHVHRHVLVAVVDAEGEPDELRQDGRAPAPDPDDLVAAGAAHLLRLLEEEAVDEGAF